MDENNGQSNKNNKGEMSGANSGGGGGGCVTADTIPSQRLRFARLLMSGNRPGQWFDCRRSTVWHVRNEIDRLINCMEGQTPTSAQNSMCTDVHNAQMSMGNSHCDSDARCLRCENEGDGELCAIHTQPLYVYVIGDMRNADQNVLYTNGTQCFDEESRQVYQVNTKSGKIRYIVPASYKRQSISQGELDGIRAYIASRHCQLPMRGARALLEHLEKECRMYQ